MSARQSTRKRRENNSQSVFDEFTQCRGLTQDELEDDIKLLKMAQFSHCSKFKPSNTVSKHKRGIIRSLYDKKDIASDLAKQSNQLSVELNALKQHTEKLRHDVVYQQTQIRVHTLQKEMLHKQFALLQQQSEQQLHALTAYHEQCTCALSHARNEMKSAVSSITQDSSEQHQLQSALALIQSLRQQLQTKNDIITIFKQKELAASNNNNNNNNNDDDDAQNAHILQLNEKFTQTEQQLHQQQAMNHKLKIENEELTRKLHETKQSFENLYQEYEKCIAELSQCKHALIQTRSEHDALQLRHQDRRDTLQYENAHYQQMCATYASQQEQQQVLNASLSVQHYRASLKQNGVQDSARMLQQKYNELESKFMRLSQQQHKQQQPQQQNINQHDANQNTDESLTQFDLENIVIEERQQRHRLKQQLQAEKQRYFERVVQFTDDLEVLYRKCEFALHENQKIKHDAKKKTFDLQRQNEKLRNHLKQSHSNLRVKQTEAESKHKEYEHQHQQTVKQINGNKIDLQKRVEILKSVVSDLSTALGEAHVQMLSFQKQVFEETGCALPNDDQLVISTEVEYEHDIDTKLPLQLQLQQPPQVSMHTQPQPQPLAPPPPAPRTPPLQSVRVYPSSTNDPHPLSPPSAQITTQQQHSPHSHSQTMSSTHAHANNVKSLRKRARGAGGDEASTTSSQSAPQTPQSKRRKRSTAASQEYSQSVGKTGVAASGSGASSGSTHHHPRVLVAEDEDDASSSSSSSEVSHGSHFTDDEVYVFQSDVQEIHDDERQFFGILTNTKTGTTLIPGDFIKITRRGHPDYTGKIEYMFLDKATQKKKVCVSVYQLASDIPLLNRCKVVGDNAQQLHGHGKPSAFHEGRREHVQLMLSKKYQQFKEQPNNSKIYGVPRIHINKKVSLWFPKKNMNFKDIERKTSGRDVFFCRYRYDKHKKELIRIDGHMDRPMDST